MNTEELRDLLRTGGEEPPPVLSRTTGVAARVRARRNRRRALTAATATVLAAAGATAVYLPSRDASPVAADPAASEPEVITDPDGSVYRKTSSEWAVSSQAYSTTLRGSGRSYALKAVCSEVTRLPYTLSSEVSGTREVSGLGAVYCGPATMPFELPPIGGSESVELLVSTADTTPLPAGLTLTLYEWTPPSTDKAGSPLRNWSLKGQVVAKGTAVWPGTDGISLDLPAGGRLWRVLVTCSGPLTGQAKITVEPDPYGPRPIPCADQSVAKGARYLSPSADSRTVTFRFVPPNSTPTTRPTTWRVLLAECPMYDGC